jgi:hypothetical protein
MNCLECSLSPTIDVPMTAIGDYAYCGAGVCLDHARVITFGRQQIGVVPEVRTGKRRIVCTTCYGGTSLEPGGTLTASASGVRGTEEEPRTPAAARAGQ